MSSSWRFLNYPSANSCASIAALTTWAVSMPVTRQRAAREPDWPNWSTQRACWLGQVGRAGFETHPMPATEIRLRSDTVHHASVDQQLRIGPSRTADRPIRAKVLMDNRDSCSGSVIIGKNLAPGTVGLARSIRARVAVPPELLRELADLSPPPVIAV